MNTDYNLQSVEMRGLGVIICVSFKLYAINMENHMKNTCWILI